MASHVLVQDPSSISSRFSNESRLGYDPDFEPEDLDFEELIKDQLAPSPEEDLSSAKSIDFSSISRYLCRIPPREADLILLYHHDKMKQEQIAKLFRITQAAVSYRLHRGIRRIQFLRTIPELDREIFELELGPKFSDQDREILWRMYITTCQSEIAKQMKLTQGRVRHRFFRSLQRIKDLIADEAKEAQVRVQMLKRMSKPSEDVVEAEAELEDSIKNSKYGKYYTVFFAISDKHFNILHEVSLPQFRDRGDAQILPIE
jgi:DNA-directed RNA polymerase specialized sigma24 family protein